ncbi:MAG: hypothetical protein AB1716_17670 [Planctomycetota bacterium]
MDRKLRIVVMLLAGAACGCAAAGIVPIGDPISGQSWGQKFAYEAPAGTVVQLGARIFDGGPFESPTFSAFDAPDWALTFENHPTAPTLAYAGTQSNPVVALGFEVWFEPEPSEPVSFVFAAWAPGQETPLEAYRLTWLGNGGTAGPDFKWISTPWVWLDNPTVPAPAAVVLGATGLGIVGLLRRRRAT